MVGISRTYLRKLETAEASPTFEMVERISAGLGIAPHELINFEHELHTIRHLRYGHLRQR